MHARTRLGSQWQSPLARSPCLHTNMGYVLTYQHSRPTTHMRSRAKARAPLGLLYLPKSVRQIRSEHIRSDYIRSAYMRSNQIRSVTALFLSFSSSETHHDEAESVRERLQQRRGLELPRRREGPVRAEVPQGQVCVGVSEPAKTNKGSATAIPFSPV